MTARPDEPDGDELVGDPACWLGRVCAGCGALMEGPRSTACWRCGRMPADDEEEDRG